jgi:hypothetical protein
MVTPLRHSDNLTTAEWFGHGAIKYPPAKGDFLELPAGESVTFELQCNRAFTSYRDPNIKRPLAEYACEVSRVGLGRSMGERQQPLPTNSPGLDSCISCIRFLSVHSTNAHRKALDPCTRRRRRASR